MCVFEMALELERVYFGECRDMRCLKKYYIVMTKFCTGAVFVHAMDKTEITKS